jgi:hypothetical protein
MGQGAVVLLLISFRKKEAPTDVESFLKLGISAHSYPVPNSLLLNVEGRKKRPANN